MKAEKQSAEMKQLDRIKRKSIRSLYDGGTPSLRGTLIKIAALGLLDAFAVFTAYLLLMKRQYIGVAGVLIVAIVVSFLYLRRGGLPAKYLTPGILFLLVFQVYVVVFSGYISFTNFGSMHNSDQASAVNAIRLASYNQIDTDFDSYADSGQDNNQDGVADYTDANGKVIVDAAGNPVGPDAAGAAPAGAVKVPYYTVSVVKDGAGVLGFIATEDLGGGYQRAGDLVVQQRRLGREIGQHVGDLGRVGPGCFHPGLRLGDARGGDQLLGLGDLLDRPGRADSSPQFAQCRCHALLRPSGLLLLRGGLAGLLRGRGLLPALRSFSSRGR